MAYEDNSSNQIPQDQNTQAYTQPLPSAPYAGQQSQAQPNPAQVRQVPGGTHQAPSASAATQQTSVQPVAAQQAATQPSQPAYGQGYAAQGYTAQQQAAYQQAYQQATAQRVAGRPATAATAATVGAGTTNAGTANTAATGAYAGVQPTTRKATKAAKQKSGGGFKTFGLGFLGAALAFALGSGILVGTGVLDRQPAVTETVSEGGTVVLGSDTNTQVTAVDDHTESRAEAVADKVLPSVVGIDVYANISSSYGSFWGGGSSDSETLSGLGSGVVISEDGYILTNYHVVEGASKLMVTVNGEEEEATLVGSDESSDLAVIKVDATGLTPVEIGSSDNLRPGQWVMTLGSPFGLEQSVATGIISATSRTVVIQNSSSIYGYGQEVAPSIYSNMIQTDAAINPGNSGGALVDENGKLIGINSVIESYSGSYSGVGFAIPVDYAMNIATQIIDGKTPTHAQLGVSTTTVDADISERYDLGVKAGAYINKVYEDSGAQAAGLMQGDIITKVGNETIASSTDLVGQIRAHKVGETVSITYVRDGQTNTVDVTLGSDEETLASQYSQEQQMPYGNGWGNGWGNGNGNGQGNGWNWNFDGNGGNGSEGQDQDGQGFSWNYDQDGEGLSFEYDGQEYSWEDLLNMLGR